MRDARTINNQQWLQAENAWRAPFERVIRNHIENIDYSVASQPQYWAVFDYLPDLRSPSGTGQVAIPFQSTDEILVGVTASATLVVNATADVASIGFLGAAIGYLRNQQSNQPQDINCVPVNFGNTIPQLGQLGFLNNPEQSVSYDPTSLPVGGVDFPIWTRTAVDPLTSQVYLDRSGPGIYWFASLVQVNGSVDAVAAASVITRWEWAPV